MSSGYNLGKNLSKREEYDQLIKYKDTRLYIYLYISKDYEKRKRCSWENNKGEIRRIW